MYVAVFEKRADNLGVEPLRFHFLREILATPYNKTTGAKLDERDLK
jgi:hypothetical protein